FSPKLTDAEVISMEIIGEFLGIDTDKGIWLYFKTHWQDWLPALGSRSSFVRQASNLWQLKQKLQSMTAKQ
ncbi:MAG: IS982 family transposase, partial [Betaproteobacteria bacterium]|nr:IS982 family transposase [Betaproteobacteria bacterium]